MNKLNKKVFMISCVSTVYIILLFIGFSVVEKNAQKIISETTSPFFDYEKKSDGKIVFKIHFMGKDYVFKPPQE